MSGGARVAILAVAIGAAVALFLVLNGGDDESDTTTSAATAKTTTAEAFEPDKAKPEPKPEVATIEIEDGEPVGGVQELSFKAGEDIRFVVESDEAWEVHFHGYDVAQDVEAGGKTEFDVPADIEGVFEAELEETATPIAEITVEP